LSIAYISDLQAHRI